MHHPYVVILPNYMVYSQDFDTLIGSHISSGADITLLYHTIDNAKELLSSLQHRESEPSEGCAFH